MKDKPRTHDFDEYKCPPGDSSTNLSYADKGRKRQATGSNVGDKRRKGEVNITWSASPPVPCQAIGQDAEVLKEGALHPVVAITSAANGG